MFFYSDDPLTDFDLWEAEQDRQRDQLPVCSHCGEPIQDEALWDIDGELYHTACAEEEFKKCTEDYI